MDEKELKELKAKLKEEVEAEFTAKQEEVKKAELEAEKIKAAESEKLKADLKAAEEKRLNTLGANERLAKSKEEAVKISEELKEREARILKAIDEAEAKAAKAALKAKEELVKDSLKQAGFTSEDLLSKTFEIDKIEIKDGKIKGFDETVKTLKEKYPTLYVDGAAKGGVNQTQFEFVQKAGLVEILTDIESKLKEGKELSRKDKITAVFGGYKK